MKKVLVTCRIPKEGLIELFEMFDVTYPEKEVMTRNEVLSAIREYDCIIPVGIKMDREMLDFAGNLKIISVFGAGYDNVDVDYATEKGIVVANAPDSVTETTAELCFGLMLAVMRRIAECDRKLRHDKGFEWGTMKNLGHTLYGKTLGIIGMGRIGKAVARRARASGMKIIYHNRNRLDISTEAETGAVYAGLEELLKASDIVSVNTPLTRESYHLIGERELSLMKPSAYIVNTSRGAVIDEQALVNALKNGRIAGAGLDVFEKEPVISPELLKMDKVVLTPHIGSGAIETRIQMAREAARNVIDFFSGIKPRYVVNPRVFEA